jgi:MoaA/NifB/PqqE/SkfB family radical SAM enzyme
MYYTKKSPKPEYARKDWELWKRGLKNLKDHGNGFLAVYGAEPLMDMEYLPEFFTETEKLGMLHTLITNCSLKDTKERLIDCQKGGLNSLTVSFDGSENENKDKSSQIKSDNAIGILEWFKSNYPMRDASVVFTLTRTNINAILEWIPTFAKMGIFVFFDLIHTDIGNPGTKCRSYKGIEDLLFREEDAPMLVEFAKKMKEMKKDPFLKPFIHQSDSFLDVLINKTNWYIKSEWNCAWSDKFPSWLTIDYDGKVRVCDDFHLDDVPQQHFWDLDYDKLRDQWKQLTLDHCNGCFWNTHFDANMIKEGKESFANYVNNQLK